MRTGLSGRRRATLAGPVAVVALAIAYPAHGLAWAADAAVEIHGGNAVDLVDCRSGGDNECHAEAKGGDVSLTSVDIFFKPGDSMQVNGGSVDAATVAGGDAEAAAVCINENGEWVRGKRVSKCRAKARGGAVKFRDVKVILHRRDGSTTTKRRDIFALRARPSRSNTVCTTRGRADADCDASAGGGVVQMRNVNLFDRKTNERRTNISVEITGGDASAFVICGSGGSGVSKCSATAEGGDVTLEDVRLHIWES